MNKCNLCPRKCNIDRNIKKGFCKADNNVRVALSMIHHYEEPCISGNNGSGAIFFAGCNLKCKFCQNYQISQEYICGGKNTDIKEISGISNLFLDMQNKNCHNINLVTAFAYVPQIIESIKLAKKKGLIIPIVYNSSGYESLDTLKMLEGYVDIYLPDFKYYYNELGTRLSGVNNYFEYASKAFIEMKRQVGENKFDENGIMKKGMIVRHLILPNHIQNSKKCLKWVKDNLGSKTLISVMAQYFPTYRAFEVNDISRKITQNELDEVAQYINKIGLKNGFIQEIENDEEKYVPDF